MLNLTEDQLKGWIGRTLVDPSGDKIGKIADIYMDDDTDQPEWLAVTTGLFGSKVSFAPITGATTPAGDDVRSQFYRGQVKEAPNAEADGQLSQDEEARLYTHYGIDYSEKRSDSGLPKGDPAPVPAAGSTDDAMTRSEEELEVAKTSREAGRVKLRKWVDVERVETTVPVAHDEVRIEREPITDGNLDHAMAGADITEAEHEIVLTQEEAVANTRVVPKERIRAEKDVVTEQQQVAADLRKERVEVEGDASRR